MTGTVTINGVTYQVGISDLTPADVLPVFRTDTSILKTDSILLHAAGAQQNSAKKVLIPHLISLISSAVAEDTVLTIEPYYDANGEYKGMYWHYNGQWLRRSDTGEMISVTDDAAEIALAAEQAVEATIAAKAATTAATNTESRVSAAEELRVQAENQRKSNEQQRTSTFADNHQTATQDHTRADDDHQTAGQDHTRAEDMHAHQPYIADGTAGYPGDAGYFYSWDYTEQQYVRGPKLSLDWASMTQAERDALAADMLAAILFDSTPTEDSQNAVTSGGVYAALQDKSNTGHTHDERYYTEGEINLFLQDKSNTGHTHDERYYTEEEINLFLQDKSNTGHTHDERYYTEEEINLFLQQKQNNLTFASAATCESIIDEIVHVTTGG